MKRLKTWFIKFEIQAWWNKKVEELSKGMQQKVQFITTIIHEPRLLIFDEPFSGFDPINSNLLKNEILQLKKNGATIIFSTHDMGSVEELCDYITLINKSKTLLEGAVHDIKMNYKTNTFEIGFKDNPAQVLTSLNGHCQVIHQYESRESHFIKVKVDQNMNGNDMLGLVLPFTSITSFNEIIPTMNEIFINVVEAQNKKTTGNHE
jgi:ABC-2 type transport system ATP-binding protein